MTAGAIPLWRPLFPFAPRSFQTAAGRLHYVDVGPRDAPVLLCLHGNPTWSFYYRRLIADLSARYRVIGLDHLGCGLSDKPQNYPYKLANRIADVRAFAESLDLRRITLIVHDWGGAIGLGFAQVEPERIERLVISNTAAFPSRRIPLSIDVCRVPGFGALAIRGLNVFSRAALIRAVAHRERLSPAIRAGYLAPYASWRDRVAQLRFVEDIPMRPEHPSYALLASIGEGLGKFAGHPILLLWGERDFCFDRSFFDEWRWRFPRAAAELYPDASHYVLEDAHERILPRLAGWLEATDAG